MSNEIVSSPAVPSAIAPLDIEFTGPPAIAILNNGYLNASNYAGDVELTFTVPADAEDFFDSFTIYVNSAPVGDDLEVFVGGEIASMTIPAGTFSAEGTYTVYIYLNRAGGELASPTLDVLVDITAPGGEFDLPPIQFNIVLPEGHLTLPMLEDQGDVLVGKIVGYLGLNEGDMIQLYMSDVAVGSPYPVPTTLRGKSIPVSYPRDLLETATFGELTCFHYTVTDLAGNPPATADKTCLYIDIANAPANLQKPLVPAFDDDTANKLIDDADARAGVTVGIPLYTNAAEGDVVTVSWGSQVILPGVALTAADLLASPMIRIPVSYLTLATANGGVDPTTVAVTYTVSRSAIVLATSPPDNVVVDLELAGGPDPDPETPENTNLLAPTSTGASNFEHVISVEDAAGVIDVSIPVASASAGTALKPGDMIDVVWGGSTLITAYEVTAADLSGTTLVLKLPTGAIVALPGGDVSVHYIVSRLLANGVSRNTSISPDEIVAVTSIKDLPGEGTLVAGTYPISLPGRTPERDNLLVRGMYYGSTKPPYPALGYFEFKVPYYRNMAVGDTIELTVEGYRDLSGNTGDRLHTQTYSFTVQDGEQNSDYPCRIDNAMGVWFHDQPTAPGVASADVFGTTTTYTVTGKGPVTSAPVDIDNDMRE